MLRVSLRGIARAAGSLLDNVFHFDDVPFSYDTDKWSFL